MIPILLKHGFADFTYKVSSYHPSQGSMKERLEHESWKQAMSL